uniref:C-type lectin domain-containing protein n=1 Tax=Steinernema glaseri TaxID=37863 RepID=A0A1I8AQU6_9BILA
PTYGVNFFQSSDKTRCYFLQVSMQFVNDVAGARHYCDLTGGYLASIPSKEDNQIIVNNTRGKGQLWIGASNPGSGRYGWDDNTTFGYANWAAGQPDNYGVKKCVMFDTTTGLWATEDCNKEMNYLCELLDPLAGQPTPSSCPEGAVCYNGYGYIYTWDQLQNESNWKGAGEFCQYKYNGHLPSIHDTETRSVLNMIAYENPEYMYSLYWLGGYVNSNNQTLWSDGTPWDFDGIPWHFRETQKPNTCLFLQLTPYGVTITWGFDECFIHRMALCQFKL